jgi:hypothetical protein
VALTDTFASTAAVTIPVLMLAGAVELRSLADTVTNRMAGTERRSYMRIFEMTEDLAELYKQTGRQTNPIKILGMLIKNPRLLTKYLRLVIKSVEALPLPGVPLSLSVVWLAAIILSGVSETLCFLHLAGVNVPSGATLLLSIIAIVVLMVLLILTPATRTFITAPRIGRQQFAQSFNNADLLERYSEDIEFLKAFLGAVSVGIEFDEFAESNAELAKKIAAKIQSLLSKPTPTKRNNNDRQ